LAANAVTTVKILDENVTVAKLPASVDLSGKTSVVLPGEAISGRTAITTLEDADLVLVHDATDSALKKMTRANLWNALGASGAIIQSVTAFDGTHQSITNVTNPEMVISSADSVPPSDDGLSVVEVSITPRLSTSYLRVRGITGNLSSNAARVWTAILSRDSGDALVISTQYGVASQVSSLAVETQVASGSTAATTFKLKVGSLTTGNYYLNGSTSARQFGGVAGHRIVVEEVLS
jgi:hypothetical protein